MVSGGFNPHRVRKVDFTLGGVRARTPHGSGCRERSERPSLGREWSDRTGVQEVVRAILSGDSLSGASANEEASTQRALAERDDLVKDLLVARLRLREFQLAHHATALGWRVKAPEERLEQGKAQAE